VANSQPSRNPANSSGDFTGGMREILRKFLVRDVDDMIPATVVAYDRASNRATVQPQIAVLKTDGSFTRRNQVASVPVVNIGGGNAVLSFNLNPGDLGWLKASDRDIAEFLKNYSESLPATKRIHDFNNGIFIPDMMTGYTIDEEDEGNAVLQTLDGTVKVSLFPDKLKLTAPVVEVAAAAQLGGPAGLPIARLGDQVTVGGNVGVITSASGIHRAT